MRGNTWGGDSVRTLTTGPVGVHYGQLYVQSHEFVSDLGASYAGQQNGLCGAAVPGALFLITGLHTGDVGFSTELHDSEPPVDDTWEEIVEASFTPVGATTALVGWAGEWQEPLDLAETDYRVRYCGIGMDSGHETDNTLDGEPLVDHYLLQFWPAPPEPDRVIKVTSGTAAYWHDYARQQAPPPTAEERAETERQAVLEHERRQVEARLAVETRDWGGKLPSEPLRALGWAAIPVALLDRAAAEAIARADAGSQRGIARWAARRAYEEAQLTEHDWIAAALAAMDRGEELPEPFDTTSKAFDRAWGDPGVAKTLITTRDGRYDNFSQQAMAIPAIFEACADDPLAAAIGAVRVSVDTFGFGREQEFLAELRQAFPVLADQP
ncbi:hypothetical protein E0H75_34580 [Kribbella capetownensis]|uniref:Uncharacterized protein n=1 Tax=Kribbella capetownensis TaxID=1572659 RepID=A0A4V2M6R7_9ACTN|nr:hypothetical protein E0H75_34580 [Kribbella capetownensis]